MKKIREQISYLEETFNVTILVAKIKGYRWAFENNSQKPLSVSSSHKIQLDSNKGVVIYNWENLNQSSKILLKNKISEMEWSEQ